MLRSRLIANTEQVRAARESVSVAEVQLDNTVIRAKSLEVKLAAEDAKMQLTFGDCELAVGDAPEDEAGGGKRKGGARGGKRDGSSEPPATPPTTT